MLQVEWDNADIIWEPLSKLWKDNPISIPQYTQKINLQPQRG